MLLTENKEKKYIKCIESIKNTSQRNKLKLISKLLFESFDSWIFCGFYFKDGDKLFISEYSADKIPCSPIEFNGVCGTAILKNQILNMFYILGSDNTLHYSIRSKLLDNFCKNNDHKVFLYNPLFFLNKSHTQPYKYYYYYILKCLFSSFFNQFFLISTFLEYANFVSMHLQEQDRPLSVLPRK